MDNDSLHKFTYRLCEFLADLLRLVAPALAAELDFDRAEELPTAYVEPARGGLEQRSGDLAWRVPWRNDGGDGRDDPAGHLIVLIEFQSTVNRQMAGRMREYSDMARQRQPADDGAAALLPIVLYNGSDRWTAAGAAADFPAPWSAAVRLALAPFQGWHYVLYSLERVRSSGGLADLPLRNRAAATLRLQAAPTPEELLAQLRREWVRFSGPAEAATRRVLHAWASALLTDMGAEPGLPTLAELEGLNGGTEMTTVSQALLGKWVQDVRAEAVEGERARGLARLRRQAAIKFGARTSDRLRDLLATPLPAEQVMRLEDRASEWMMECEDGAELLARVSAFVHNGGGTGH